MFEGKKLICPINGSKKFIQLLRIKKFPIYMGVVEKNHNPEFMNMNFKINKYSGSVQIDPKVPLKKLYLKSHGSGTVGKTWKNHHKTFFNFISKNFKGTIIEIGGGHNSISQEIINLKKKDDYKLISFDPNGKNKKNKNHILIKDFFSKKYSKKWKAKTDVIIHSHLFEHVYEPNQFLKNIYDTLKDDALHIFSVPNLKLMIQNGYANAMNFEHPYYLEEKIIDYLLKKNGFKILQKKKYLKHSIFYKTRKLKKLNKNKITYKNFQINKIIFKNYFNKIKHDVSILNSKAKLINNGLYIFGAHIFSQMLIFNGLKTTKLLGILDNDQKKHNKFLYGTKLKVYNPSVLKKIPNPTVIIRAAQYSDEIKKQIIKSVNKNTKFI